MLISSATHPSSTRRRLVDAMHVPESCCLSCQQQSTSKYKRLAQDVLILPLNAIANPLQSIASILTTFSLCETTNSSINGKLATSSSSNQSVGIQAHRWLVDPCAITIQSRKPTVCKPPMWVTFPAHWLLATLTSAVLKVRPF